MSGRLDGARGGEGKKEVSRDINSNWGRERLQWVSAKAAVAHLEGSNCGIRDGG